MSRRDRGILLALLALAAGLRFYGIAERDVWLDEQITLLLVTSGLTDILRGDGGNPPLYFLFLRPFVEILGVDATAARLLSALAGVLSLGALGWVVRALGAPTGASLWAMALLAVAPLHILYSQEARPYALFMLFLLLAQGGLLAALRTGLRRYWVVHGAFTAAGLYTQNLMLPFVAWFWLAAALLGADRRQWRTLLVCHGLVALAYLGWAAILIEQAHSDTHLWIEDFWQRADAARLIPRSLEAFGVGGALPGDSFPQAPAARPWSLAFFGLAALALIVSIQRGDSEFTGARGPARALGVLLAFTFGPLLFLLAYSLLVQPLYLVGRYDLPALPGYLAMIGWGLHELQRGLRKRARAAAWLPVLALILLAGEGLAPKLRLGAGVPEAHTTHRLGQLLRDEVRPGDVVVALDYAGPTVRYALLRARLALPIRSFPDEPLVQLGESARALRVKDRWRPYREEARQLAISGARSGGSGRVWLIGHSIYPGREQPAHAYERLLRLLVKTLERTGFAATPEAVRPSWFSLVVVRLDLATPAGLPFGETRREFD